jgi:plastocyanin
MMAVVLLSLAALSLALGCGKGSKSTNPAVGPLELNSGNIGGSGIYAHRFFTANGYPYHCSIHTGMTGIVVVSDSAPLADSLGTVTIQGTAFQQSSVTIHTGGKVTWTNMDGFAHTVTSD